MLAVYLFRATSGAHHQEGLVMTLTASSSSRAVTNSPVVVALDYHNRDAALAFVDKIDPRDCRLKVGKEMFTLFGPQFVRELQQRGFDIFLDLKFHDIPNTAAHAVAAAADLGVWMVNVHASGGARMMTAAREALVPFGKDAPLLIAVTVLTSMEASDCRSWRDTVTCRLCRTSGSTDAKNVALMVWCVLLRKLCALNRYLVRSSNWLHRAFVRRGVKLVTSAAL